MRENYKYIYVYMASMTIAPTIYSAYLKLSDFCQNLRKGG